MSTRYEREADKRDEPIVGSGSYVTCCGERHHVEVLWPWCLRPVTHQDAHKARLPDELALQALGDGMARCTQVSVAWKRMVRQALRGLDPVWTPTLEDLTHRYLEIPEGLRGTAQLTLPTQRRYMPIKLERERRAEAAFEAVTRDLMPPVGEHWKLNIVWLAPKHWHSGPLVAGAFVLGPFFGDNKIHPRTLCGVDIELTLNPIRYLWAYHMTGGVAWRPFTGTLDDRDYYLDEPFILLDVESEPHDGPWHLAKALRPLPPPKDTDQAVRRLEAAIVHINVRPEEDGRRWRAAL